MGFNVILMGGTGLVGSTVLRALLDSVRCDHVVMVNRREVNLAETAGTSQVRQVVLDMDAADFESRIQDLASACMADGSTWCGVSCIGIGKGSQKWSDEDIKKLEIGLVGTFARGCLAGGIQVFGLLSAAGSSSKSNVRYARIMGGKEEAVRSVGFRRLAIFRPGIIAGNAHTPSALAWLGRLIPGPFGTIDQEEIGRAFVGEFLRGGDGLTILGNSAIKVRSRGR
jgi:uncharacterized protein YbjT (DUF2867 family)